MERELMAVDVALIRFARTCVAGTVDQRKARRDAVQELIDQAGETVESAGVELCEGDGFRIKPGGMPRALLTVSLDAGTVAVLSDMVAQAVWPTAITGDLEDAAINLQDTLQQWTDDAVAEQTFAQLPADVKARVLAQRAQEANL